MAKAPLISIITINLNNLEGLKRTMRSVMEQSFQDFEYLIIDGGSTDGSAEYIKRYSEKLSYWECKKDKGIYSAMNKGIKKAKGEYLYFLNSGDHFFHGEVLSENQRNLSGCDLVYFNIQIVDKNQKEFISYPFPLRFANFYYGTLCHQSTFIKRDLFEIIGLYDENLKIVSDWKFFILAVFKHNCTYKKVEDTLATFYLDGISSNPKNFARLSKEKQEVLETEFKAILPEIQELYKSQAVLQNLKKSRKIQLLTSLGMLNRF